MKDKNSRLPFFTIRETMARPVTIEEGTNTLVGTITEGVLSAKSIHAVLAPKVLEELLNLRK